ncbi:hypothetical protein ACF0H5_009213 [Mactra antiquata]
MNIEPGPYLQSVQTLLETPCDSGTSITKTDQQLRCGGCCNVLHDRWLLTVGDSVYHMSCLRCCVCLRTLDNHYSCFIRDNEVMCKYHYYSRFGEKCNTCNDVLLPTDMIRRLGSFVFHSDCVCCTFCKRKLTTGDTCIMKNDGIICPGTCETSPVTDDDNISVSSLDSEVYHSESSEEKSQLTKRMRTVFTQQQSAILQNVFSQNPNPRSELYEHLAEKVGHSKRAIKIWFQNCRARNKKRLVQEGLTSSGRARITDSCHWIANPCSPDTLPFME